MFSYDKGVLEIDFNVPKDGTVRSYKIVRRSLRRFYYRVAKPRLIQFYINIAKPGTIWLIAKSRFAVNTAWKYIQSHKDGWKATAMQIWQRNKFRIS